MSELGLYFCQAWGPEYDDGLAFLVVANNSEEADRRAEDYITNGNFCAISKEVLRVDEVDGYAVKLEPLPQPKEPSWVHQPKLPLLEGE